MSERVELEKETLLTDRHAPEHLAVCEAAFDAGYFPVVYEALLTAIKHVSCSMEGTEHCACREEFTPVPTWALKATIEYLGKSLAGVNVELGMAKLETLITHYERWSDVDNAMEIEEVIQSEAFNRATMKAEEQSNTKSREAIISSWRLVEARIENIENELQIRRALYSTVEHIQDVRAKTDVNVKSDH